MKSYSLIMSDVYMSIPQTCIWIDPEVDAILLWDSAWQEPASLQLVSDRIRRIDSCKEAERQIRRTPCFALGTTSLRENLDGKFHVVIPTINLDSFQWDTFEWSEFRSFVRYRTFRSLTFIWNIDDDADLDLNDVELVEEGHDNVSYKDLIQSSREKVDKAMVKGMNLASPPTAVPVFKMARIQKRSD